VGTVSTVFTRFRIKNLRFSYRNFVGSTQAGMITYGVLDDDAAIGGTSYIPNTRDQILNLRRSCETNVWKNNSLQWSPLDKSKWYYTNSDEAAIGDDRFTVPGTLVALVTNEGGSASTGFIDVVYTIEFSGGQLPVPQSSASTSTSAVASPSYVSVQKPPTTPSRR
jgi:hypothetical protein